MRRPAWSSPAMALWPRLLMSTRNMTPMPIWRCRTNGFWCCAYLPEDIDASYRQHLNRYASLRYKAMVARDRGARGLIVASGPTTTVKAQLVPLVFDASLAGSSIGAVSVTDALAEAWLRQAGRSLKELQETLDTGQLIPGFSLDGLTLGATIDIQQEKRQGRNVLARLRAAERTADAGIVVVGAHIDHLGTGLGNGSLAGEGEKGHIHFGADDNASGRGGRPGHCPDACRATSHRRGGAETRCCLCLVVWRRVGPSGVQPLCQNIRPDRAADALPGHYRLSQFRHGGPSRYRPGAARRWLKLGLAQGN